MYFNRIRFVIICYCYFILGKYYLFLIYITYFNISLYLGLDNFIQRTFTRCPYSAKLCIYASFSFRRWNRNYRSALRLCWGRNFQANRRDPSVRTKRTRIPIPFYRPPHSPPTRRRMNHLGSGDASNNANWPR